MTRKTQRLEAIVTSLIETGIKQGSFRDDLPIPLIANALYGMVNWTHRWYKPSGKYDARQIAEAFGALLLQGLHKPQP
jgi:TetR/AcrR family transcriptional regulator, cholesterol catabolism regulator